jgi:hypothetical protein
MRRVGYQIHVIAVVCTRCLLSGQAGPEDFKYEGYFVFRKLLSANPARIGRFDGPSMSDAVCASLVDGTPGDLKADLIALLGKENVFHRAIDLVRYTSDASPYRLVPQVVVLPRTANDIIKLFRYCHETGRHVTFRAAGTSLNGQSLSDDILIDVRRHWNGGEVEDDGRRVRRRNCEQRRWHAVYRGERCLPYRLRAHVRNAIRRCN